MLFHKNLLGWDNKDFIQPSVTCSVSLMKKHVCISTIIWHSGGNALHYCRLLLFYHIIVVVVGVGVADAVVIAIMIIIMIIVTP